jgi:hypothetical protein
MESENQIVNPIAKVISIEDFIAVCQNLDAMSKWDNGGIVWQKNDMKTKIEGFVRK